MFHERFFTRNLTVDMTTFTKYLKRLMEPALRGVFFHILRLIKSLLKKVFDHTLTFPRFLQYLLARKLQLMILELFQNKQINK